jgi:hypothetical protein
MSGRGADSKTNRQPGCRRPNARPSTSRPDCSASTVMGVWRPRLGRHAGRKALTGDTVASLRRPSGLPLRGAGSSGAVGGGSIGWPCETGRRARVIGSRPDGVYGPSARQPAGPHADAGHARDRAAGIEPSTFCMAISPRDNHKGRIWPANRADLGRGPCVGNRRGYAGVPGGFPERIRNEILRAAPLGGTRIRRWRGPSTLLPVVVPAVAGSNPVAQPSKRLKSRTSSRALKAPGTRRGPKRGPTIVGNRVG